MQESKNPLPKSENLLEMQLASWNRGEPLSLETLFGLMNEPNVELMLDLIYQDVCRREDDGEHLTSAEYSARFPQLHVDIESLFEVHRAMKRDFDLEASEENVAGSSYSERYSHSRELGVGGLGRVFLAHDRHLGRSIAIKKLLPQYSQSRHHRERFLREATLTAKLAHPAIVPIYDMGSDEHGELYYSMKFLDGQSLDDLAVSRGPQFRWSDNRSELRRLVNYLVSVCRGVSHAHERGILHRDIKPANILVGDQDDALLVDWGIAGFKQPAELNSPLHETAVSCDEEQSTQIGKTKTSPGKKTNSSSDRLTVAGMRLGTPAFMSPEQLEDPQNAIEQSDVFSLGATLYFSLKGHAPNQDATYGEWAPPKALLAICNKSLSPQLSKRYATVSDLASDLENWLAGDPISAHPEGIAKKAWRWCVAHRNLVISAVAVCVVAYVVSMVYLMQELRVQEAKNERLQEQSMADRRLYRTAMLVLATSRELNSHTIFVDLPSDQADERHPLRTAIRKQCLEIIQDGTPEQQANLHLSIAMCSSRLAEFEMAKTHVIKAIEQFEVLPKSPLVLDAKLLLAELYLRAEEADKVLEIALEAEKDFDLSNPKYWHYSQGFQLLRGFAYAHLKKDREAMQALGVVASSHQEEVSDAMLMSPGGLTAGGGIPPQIKLGIPAFAFQCGLVCQARAQLATMALMQRQPLKWGVVLFGFPPPRKLALEEIYFGSPSELAIGVYTAPPPKDEKEPVVDRRNHF